MVAEPQGKVFCLWQEKCNLYANCSKHKTTNNIEAKHIQLYVPFYLVSLFKSSDQSILILIFFEIIVFALGKLFF